MSITDEELKQLMAEGFEEPLAEALRRRSREFKNSLKGKRLTPVGWVEVELKNFELKVGNDKPLAVMPSLGEFKSECGNATMGEIYEFFASRVRPVVWPTIKDFEQRFGTADNYPTEFHDRIGLMYADIIAWLKGRHV